MSDLAAARRYAGALYEQAEELGSTAAVDADVHTVHDAFEGSDELVRFFRSPIISRERKKAVVDALFGSRVEPVTLKFMHLLVDKRRESVLPAVVDAYGALRDTQMGIVPVSVRSAKTLTEADRAALQASLEQRIGKKVRMTLTVDADLIGGLVVRIGDTVFDGSLANRLATLKERLTSGAIHAN